MLFCEGTVMALSVLPSSFTPRRARLKQRVLCGRLGFSDSAEKQECGVENVKINDDASRRRRFAEIDKTFKLGSRKEQSVTVLDPVRTLILDNYDSYTYNLFQLLSVVNGAPPLVIKNDQLPFDELQRLLYQEQAFDNVVISPGPGSPVRPSDIGVSMRLLQECSDIPVLGVCMGHQALGFAHGVRVVHAPEPVHGRLSEIEHVDHPLYQGIPSGPDFKVVRYHSLMLDSSSLPPSLIATAWTVSGKPVPCRQTWRNPTTKHINGSSRLLMGVSHRSWPHHGVQFHPESIATTYGRRLMENFRDITKSYWATAPLQFREKRPRKENLLHSKLREDGPVIPLRLRWRKLQGVLSRLGGSEGIFRSLWGDNVENTFWLDSSNVDQGRARFSYIGGIGAALWQKLTYRLSNSFGQGVLRVETSSGEISEKNLYKGFFSFLDEELQRYTCRKEDYNDLPFNFAGGLVGYLGYELKCESGAMNRHSSSSPDAAFFVVDRFVAVDHQTGDVYMVALAEDNDRNVEDAEKWISRTIEKLQSSNGAANNPHHDKDDSSAGASEQVAAFFMSKSKAEYMNDVERCLRYISDGESYEICLTSQLKLENPLRDLLRLYSVLRRINPAPYSAWLHFGADGPCVCSSSPERFLQLDQKGVLEAKPIKGTVPRGGTPAEDDMLRSQLLESEKDQAENLMIVDLLRNDLGRVCEPGSVHVPHLMALESYSTVHTLVSTVRGKKRDDKTPMDCVKAAFPGGSMTGAPKLRTMEILDSIETCARGVYSGAIGYFSFNSSFDLNIVIRTLVIHDDVVSIGAGGAIVALSQAENEYEEMLLKTKAPTRAVTLCM